MRLLFPSLFFTGCNALDMAQTWQLDRIRILGASVRGPSRCFKALGTGLNDAVEVVLGRAFPSLSGVLNCSVCWWSAVVVVVLAVGLVVVWWWCRFGGGAG